MDQKDKGGSGVGCRDVRVSRNTLEQEFVPRAGAGPWWRPALRLTSWGAPSVAANRDVAATSPAATPETQVRKRLVKTILGAEAALTVPTSRSRLPTRRRIKTHVVPRRASWRPRYLPGISGTLLGGLEVGLYDGRRQLIHKLLRQLSPPPTATAPATGSVTRGQCTSNWLPSSANACAASAD